MVPSETILSTKNFVKMPLAVLGTVTVPEGSTPADLDIKIRVIRQDGQPVEVGAPEQGGTPFRVTVTGDEQGKWFWAKERKNISDAYTLFGKWGANMESNPNWYKSSVDSQVILCRHYGTELYLGSFLSRCIRHCSGETIVLG